MHQKKQSAWARMQRNTSEKLSKIFVSCQQCENGKLHRLHTRWVVESDTSHISQHLEKCERQRCAKLPAEKVFKLIVKNARGTRNQQLRVFKEKGLESCGCGR